MKRILILFIFATIALSFKAQQSVNLKEIGLITNDFDVFGLTYKVGTYKSLWRLNVINLSGSSQNSKGDSSSNKINNIGFAFRIGKEFRKFINKNIEFRYGADLSIKYLKSSDDDKSWSATYYNTNTDYSTTSPGLNLVIGFNYVINNKFVIGAELNPGMSCWLDKRDEIYFVRKNDGSFVKKEESSQITGIGYNISNTPIQITISYRLK